MTINWSVEEVLTWPSCSGNRVNGEDLQVLLRWQDEEPTSTVIYPDWQQAFSNVVRYSVGSFKSVYYYKYKIILLHVCDLCMIQIILIAGTNPGSNSFSRRIIWLACPWRCMPTARVVMFAFVATEYQDVTWCVTRTKEVANVTVSWYSLSVKADFSARCPSAWFNSKTPEWILMKFAMDCMSLDVTLNSLFNSPRSIIPTWRKNTWFM
jgi:hypothetical protein